jgi:hypothetical protein
MLLHPLAQQNQLLHLPLHRASHTLDLLDLESAALPTSSQGLGFLFELSQGRGIAFDFLLDYFRS